MMVVVTNAEILPLHGVAAPGKGAKVILVIRKSSFVLDNNMSLKEFPASSYEFVIMA